MLTKNTDLNKKENEILAVCSEIAEELASRKCKLIELAAKAMHDNRKVLFQSLNRDKQEIDKDLLNFTMIIKKVREAALHKEDNYQNYVHVINKESERMNKLNTLEIA